VTPSIRLEGSAARPIQISRLRQLALAVASTGRAAAAAGERLRVKARAAITSTKPR
jgi:hypothetical protein